MVRQCNAAATTHTQPPQSTTAGLHPISIHQMAPPVRGSKHPITAYYSVYRPRKDDRLSWPRWLVTHRNKVPPPGVEPGHVTHPSTNRARRRVTSLIRPTPLPLCHAANRWAATHAFTHTFREWNEPSCIYFPPAEHHRTLNCKSFSILQRAEGWVGLGGWLHTKMVCSPEDGYAPIPTAARDLTHDHWVTSSTPWPLDYRAT